MVYAREAKAAGSNARSLAEALAAELMKQPEVEAVEVAGPGFINIRLRASVGADVLRAALKSGSDYGRSSEAAEGPVNVEYVSANPTGPMHVGHARGAPAGSCRSTCSTTLPGSAQPLLDEFNGTPDAVLGGTATEAGLGTAVASGTRVTLLDGDEPPYDIEAT